MNNEFSEIKGNISEIKRNQEEILKILKNEEI